MMRKAALLFGWTLTIGASLAAFYYFSRGRMYGFEASFMAAWFFVLLVIPGVLLIHWGRGPKKEPWIPRTVEQLESQAREIEEEVTSKSGRLRGISQAEVKLHLERVDGFLAGLSYESTNRAFSDDASVASHAFKGLSPEQYPSAAEFVATLPAIREMQLRQIAGIRERMEKLRTKLQAR
ncbi:MAG: hypothetical protein AAB502_02755, partial [Chloroflexota bacterium]